MNNCFVNNDRVPNLIAKITDWHYQRNLIAGATDESQFVKESDL